MFTRQLHLANPGSQLPTWFNSARTCSPNLQILPSHGNHRVQCCTRSSAKQRDGPPTQSRDVSAESDSRVPPPEPTGLPQRVHDKRECTLRLVPGSDDCREDRALAESDALGRSQSPSPVISSQVHHQVQPQLSQQTNPALTTLPSPHQWKEYKQPTQAIDHPVLDHS